MDDYDAPIGLFWAGSEEATAENYLKHQEGAIVGELARRFQSPASDASQHFQGCARRLLMMRHARIEILATAKEEQPPLGSHQLTLLNICLNSYYLNLLGALDNLAWAATYDLRLLPTIDETRSKVRKFCSLTNEQFIAAIRTQNASLGDLLLDRQVWIQDVKRFRDPAAHRLPLAIVRGIMTDEEGRRYQELTTASWCALLEHRWEESEALQAQADQIGRFVPLLDGPRAPDEGIYIVPNQMAADQRAFLQLTHDFLKHLGRRRTRRCYGRSVAGCARSAPQILKRSAAIQASQDRLAEPVRASLSGCRRPS